MTAYAAPLGNAVNFDFSTSPVYAAPLGNVVNFNWTTPTPPTPPADTNGGGGGSNDRAINAGWDVVKNRKAEKREARRLELLDQEDGEAMEVIEKFLRGIQ